MNPEGQFTEDIRVRVPKAIRDAFQRLQKKHYKKEAELVREALIDYLAKHGEPIAVPITNSENSERGEKVEQVLKGLVTAANSTDAVGAMRAEGQPPKRPHRKRASPLKH